MSEIKKEKLEEAAYQDCKKSGFNNTSYAGHTMQSFINGAKWQAERMFSNEEVLELLLKGRYSNYNSLTTEEWFEQFKKK